MSSEGVYRGVRPDVKLPELEKEILAFWKDHRIFEKSLEQTRGGEPYTFYDGPPFATGLPHYGHLLAGTLKDIVPRWQTMKGRFVSRRFGWDCHGLPVEYEINKKHGLQSNREILEKMGIAKYNAECRSSVTRYAKEWRLTVERMGRWVDMDHPYYTMTPGFMQSVWWVFKRLWDKDLIYKGHKVVRYSTGVSTPLSNFEAGLNYKEVQDPSITVLFKKADEDAFFLAWTTTPWTLPSNLALAVGREIDYVRVRDPEDPSRKLILAKDLLKSVFGKKAKVEVLDTFKGTDLLDAPFEPLFGFFADRKKDGAFRVIAADHVTTETGTGIVHMAPAFGEEDYLACKGAGIPLVDPVDADGIFTEEVGPYRGLRVKDADKQIIKDLKDGGKLFKQDVIVHSYPFCWRSDTPLIYKAVEAWYVKVEALKERLQANNAKTRWVPETLRDGRFGKWLDGARDWAISRNRFWGTPLPVWSNGEETICVGSKEELETLSGKKIEDLHLDAIEDIRIPSKNGGEALRQTGGVLDCWFESGSMPYAQWNYPFENKKTFEDGFPAEFIAEGLDQTRGWFYTLMVLSTALFDEPAFRNVVVNGLILAEDGKKMSKSLRNYPDPNELLERTGADAIRLYMIDSPVVRAQELRFSEKGVRDVVRLILLKWWNAYSFFVNLANLDAFKPKGDAKTSSNVLDRWVLSKLNSLIQNTNDEMEAYRLYNVVGPLLKFIDELTNTYVRLNRRRFYAEENTEDKRLAFETLFEVLTTLSKLMAPFVPFLSEAIYRNLARGLRGAKESVHLESFPAADASLRDASLEGAVARMEELLLMGRAVRERVKVPVKTPLKKLTVVHREAEALEAMRALESYVKEELNVYELAYDSAESDYVSIGAKANFPKLGPRLGKEMGAVSGAIAKLSFEQIEALERGESLELAGHAITAEDVEIRRTAKRSSEGFSVGKGIVMELDTSVDEDQRREGLSRVLIRKIQAARKSADLALDDRIALQLSGAGSVEGLVRDFRQRIMEETLCTRLEWVRTPQGDYKETLDVEGDAVALGLSIRNGPDGET